MVNYSAQSLDRVFSALSDPTRREILATLTQGESTVSDLARPFRMSLPAVSKHLTVLERAGLIKRHRDGRVHHIEIDPQPMRDAAQWIDFYTKFWTDQLNALANYLEQDQTTQETPHDPSHSPET